MELLNLSGFIHYENSSIKWIFFWNASYLDYWGWWLACYKLIRLESDEDSNDHVNIDIDMFYMLSL